VTRPASHHTTTTPTTKETAVPIQIRCTCCERVDTARIDPADFDALAAALGQDTTADTQED